MIISASRRTDLPAYYSEWFMNRVRAGFCTVHHPFRAGQKFRVSLAPEEVDAIVFWSKNPAPLLAHLDELDRRGFRYYFQFTLNDYSPLLEPGIPPLAERLKTFHALADRLGSARVVWRYDPILLTNITDPGFHLQSFKGLARALAGRTQRVMVSVVDYYAKTARRLKRLEAEGYVFEKNLKFNLELDGLLRHLAKAARESGLEIYTCAEERNYTEFGLPPGKCLDDQLLHRLFGLTVPAAKDPGQRPACGCIKSRDIGENNTCPAGCPYCYAVADPRVAAAKHAAHDPLAEALGGDDPADPSGGG